MKALTSFFFLTFIVLSSSLISMNCPDPPINDDPCIQSDNPPLLLEEGVSHFGTTCCARGVDDVNPDSTYADFGNIACDSLTTEAAVWYIYQPLAEDDAYHIVLEATDTIGDISPLAVEVYSGGLERGCEDGFTDVIAYSCSDADVSIKLGNCFAPEDYIFIKVVSEQEESLCRDFSLSISALVDSVGHANDCFDAALDLPIELMYYGPIHDYLVCTNGSLDFACPSDTTYGGCEASTVMPTVWYRIETGPIGAQMFTTIETSGWDPIWTVFVGQDCSNLTPISDSDFTCSNEDNTPELYINPVFDGESTYWVMITADPESVPSTGIVDGSFEFCGAVSLSVSMCLGSFEQPHCEDESVVIEVVDREVEGGSLDGPFLPGEEVTIHVSFEYGSEESQGDWLMGFIPMFGDGWDYESLDVISDVPVVDSIPAEWYAEDSDCSPRIQEPNPILCTYRDEDGNLQICNLLCDECEECLDKGMQPQDALPSGFFWVSEGNNIGCENDCTPGEGWGVGRDSARVEWTFSMRVKDEEDFLDCLDKIDLTIGFQTLSQGLAGCWEDAYAECLVDRSMKGPAWEVDCQTLSSSDLEKNKRSIKLQPNPAWDNVLVAYNGEENLEYIIRDIRGQEVAQGRVVNSSETISMYGLSAGLYLISFSTSDKSWRVTKKITKL